MNVTSWESEVIKRLDAIASANSSSFGDNAGSAIEAKQDEAIALLDKLSQQSEFANGVGAVQPSQTAIATTTPIEILPQSATRKRVRITNHATIATDFIIFDLNDNDNSFNSGTNSVQGRILAPGNTWESPGREEARARISILSGTNNDVPISYQETSDSVFFIGEQVILTQNLNIVDIRYSIAIVGATAVLNAMTVELYEEGVENAIATNNYSSGLIPGSIINADFLGLDGFNGTEPKEFYIIVTEG